MSYGHISIINLTDFFIIFHAFILNCLINVFRLMRSLDYLKHAYSAIMIIGNSLAIRLGNENVKYRTFA